MSEHSKTLTRRSINTSTNVPVETEVIGKIPDWLKGTLFRNGPGRYVFENKVYEHLFDGQACVQKFVIVHGKVFYSNRLLETQSYRKTVKDKRLFPNFGVSDEKTSAIKRLVNFFRQPETNDNVNVSIVPHSNNKLYAMSETNRFCEIDPENLDIVNTINIKKYVRSTKTLIAHPHFESDGSWINVGINPGLKSHYEFFRYTETTKNSKMKKEKDECLNGTFEIIASLPSSYRFGLSYFHSFGVTPNYIIFLEQPLKLSYFHLLSSLVNSRPLSDCFVIKPELQTRIHLISKQTGEIVKQKYITQSQFCFHFINCFEETKSDGTENSGDEVCIDICSYDSSTFNINNFNYENLYSGKLDECKNIKALARRIRVPIRSKQSKKTIVCEMKDINSDFPFELPTINYAKYNGLPYKYMYGTNLYRRPYSILKINVHDSNDVIEFKYGDSETALFPSEAIFVERPGAKTEDDGILLVLILSEDQNDFLSILDAKDLKELAKAEFPTNVKGIFCE